MKCDPAAPRRGISTRLHRSLRRPLYSGSLYSSLLLACLLTLGWTAAQGTDQPQRRSAAPLQTFLAALSDNPELLAAEAATQVAELQLQAARDPVALEASGGYSRAEIDESKLGVAQAPTDPGGGFAEGTLPTSGFNLSTTLSFRPLPFGDIADLLRQRELELQSSRLDLRSARAGLEARALEAALSSRLAERSVALAQQGVDAATQGLTATQKRAEKGAANARELRDAEAARLEARTLRENARADAETARLNLRSLVGATPAPSFADLSALLPPAGGTPLSVAQAQLQTELAALGISAAKREIYPVAQASYNWNVSDTSSLTASLESRTLQPSLGYSYQDPGRTAPTNAVVSSFQIGVSANISVSALQVLEGVERQQAAAEEGLKAQRTGGTLQKTALNAAYGKAQRSAELERRQFANARLTYGENVTRQNLGLSAPLTTQTSLLELLQADLERRTGELTSLSALLDLFELYALPPSETLP